MTLKLTDRDKKLLLILAIFLLVVGLGLGVIYPLMTKNQELRAELTTARLEQTEKEQKVESLTQLEDIKSKAEETYGAAMQDFYPVTQSTGIDRMLTQMAVSRGVVVRELKITMPSVGEYAQLVDYKAMLEQRMRSATLADTETQELEPIQYNGMYAAHADITMTGSRQALQQVLDEYAASEPKIRVQEFLWQSNTSSNSAGDYSLVAVVDMYMADTVEQYETEQTTIQSSEATTDESTQDDENITE